MHSADRAYWTRHHPWDTIDAEPGVTERVDADDSRIVERVVAAYRRSAGGDFYGRESMWRVFHDEKQRTLHELLLSNERGRIAEALRNPSDNYLMLGFENINRDACERVRLDNAAGRDRAARVHDLVVRLGEALGVLRTENPEGGPWMQNIALDADSVLDAVERRLGIGIAVPWFYAGLVGLRTRRGIFGHRMVHAAYCAYRVRQLSGGPIVEIGAGLGHLARYAFLMGLRDYTIVDLPLTNVAQGYFLMRTLGENAVTLEGEPVRPGAIRVLSPAHLDAGEHYDLVVNVDSFTEMGHEIAQRYLAWGIAHAPRIWSVNHEGNPFTVAELAANCRVERFPYWMRRGYVEELITP
jgi:hypothetical protein